MLGTIFNSKKRPSNNESLKKIRTEELITRPTTQGLGLKEQIVNIIPDPDIIEFYDADFKKQTETENLSRENTPYFISKYFNPLRFDKTGTRLDTDTEIETEVQRQQNFKEAGEAIQKNQNFTCSKTLNSGFFNTDKLNEETDIIILLYVFSGTTSAILNGFIMGNDLNIIPEDEPEESKENVFYIDAICANPRQPRREGPGPELPKISFGRKLLDHVKEFAKEKDYYGISLSSLMYVINYYRKNEFKHLPKLDGITEKTEDPKIKELAEKFAKAKFKNDAEIEDYMFVELAMMNTEDNEAKKKAAIKNYWEVRNLFEGEDSDDEIVNKIFTNYNEKFNDSSDIGKFIKKLSEKGFSTQRKIYDNIPKNERKSKRVMIKSIIQDESNPSSEGFKMTYQFPIPGKTGGKKQRKTKKQTKRKFKKQRKYKTKKQRKSVRKQATKKSKRKSRKSRKSQKE